MRFRLAVGLLFLVLAGSIIWFVREKLSTEPAAAPAETARTDPRVSYTGPFHNVHPDVKYVGDTVCSQCHADKAESYRQHGMGRSLRPIADVIDMQRYHEGVRNPFEAFQSQLFVDRRDDHIWHRQTHFDTQGKPAIRFDAEVHFVIGSGERGHSYLTNREGYLFQTAISWYTQKRVWDMSPGFGSGLRLRPIVAECLFCHSNRVEPVEHSLNRYHLPIFRGHAIGCERCHGPGERHAETTRPEDIVNPNSHKTTADGQPLRLSWQLREAICQQCHLEGKTRVSMQDRQLFDYRPGLPLHEFWAVFVPANEPAGDHPAVSHVEQMYTSRCFLGSSNEDKLGCASCHDPHRHLGPQQRVSWYRQRCLTCHQQRYPDCSLPRDVRLQKNAQDSCIDCHMPRYAPSDIAHTAATDHRIPREPSRPSRSVSHEKAPASAAPLKAFYDPWLRPEERESPRYLALALAQIARDKKEMLDSLSLALHLLEEALVEHPRDLALWEAKGTCLLLLQQRLPEALAAFQGVLAEVPNDEGALKLAGLASLQLGEYKSAVDYWRRAAALNPWMADYRASLALALSRLGQWDEALRTCRKAIELDPFNAQARVLLAVCLHRRGDKAQAQAEFEQVRALQAPDFDMLRELFLKETR